MAIDWTKIEGYNENLSAEEKLALLEQHSDGVPPAAQEGEPADPKSLKGYVPKAQFDKVSSDLAAVKKQLRSKMTEDEQREADRQANDAAIQAELETLRRDKAVSTHKASYLAMGYDEKTANAAAVAMVDGDNEALFAAMRQHDTDAAKALRTQILNDTPAPPPGESGDGKSEAVKLAERVAKSTSDSNKAASDVLAHYI